MNNFFETMDNCRQYIKSNSKVKVGFENLERSSCAGFEYELKNGILVPVAHTINLKENANVVSVAIPEPAVIITPGITVAIGKKQSTLTVTDVPLASSLLEKC